MMGGVQKPKVLVVARDAGAANALVPVVRTLITDGRVSACVIGYRYAEAVFRQNELPLWAMPDDGAEETVAGQILDDERPDFVLTGTSMRARRDGAFWSGARARGIPSLAVLDHWAHYWERFSDPDGPRFHYLPDVITVMDEVSRKAMIEEGCPAARLIITSQPAFDDFDSFTPAAESDLRHSARRDLNVPDGTVLITFASEPVLLYYGADESSPTFLGYTEVDALRMVLQAVQSLPDHADRPTEVIVKLHPVETPDVLRSLVRQTQDLKVRTLKHFPAKKLIAASDVIIGMTSIFLLEAALFGRPTISIEPGRRVDDGYIKYQGGLIRRATEFADFISLLQAAMRESENERRERRRLAKTHGFDGCASRRVADIIYSRIQKVKPDSPVTASR